MVHPVVNAQITPEYKLEQLGVFIQQEQMLKECLNVTFINCEVDDLAIYKQIKNNRYLKIKANGSLLPDNANVWACVIDTKNKLMWEVKTKKKGIHNRNNKYRWGGKTALDYGGNRYTDWNSLVNGSNQKRLCGFSNWRVPSKDELSTIVECKGGMNMGGSAGCFSWLKNTRPTINMVYFPYTNNYFYWSSSTHDNSNDAAWSFSFGQGGGHFIFRNSGLHLRLVRGM